MAHIKLKDVINRVQTKVDKDNTSLIYYVGGEHIESENVCITKRGLIEGSTIGPMFYYGFKAGDFLLVSRNPHLKKAGVVALRAFARKKLLCLQLQIRKFFCLNICRSYYKTTRSGNMHINIDMVPRIHLLIGQRWQIMNLNFPI